MTNALTKAIGSRVPAVRRLVEQRDALAAQVAAQATELKVLEGLPWPPGHFYSPFPSLDDVRSRRAEIFICPSELPEIDADPVGQLALVAALSPLAHQATLPDQADDRYRYHYENDFFSYGDGLVLHCMLRWLQPSHIVEIGSGFSSALILDTDERHLGGRTKCTFIEPYPDRLMGLLRGGDDANAEVPLPGYAVWRLGLSYQWPHFQVTATVRNLFDRRFSSFGSYTDNPLGNPVDQPERFYTPAQPRSFVLAMTVSR